MKKNDRNANRQNSSTLGVGQKAQLLETVCQHPKVFATIIEVVNIPVEQWQQEFPRTSQKKVQQLVASLAPEQSTAALAFLTYEAQTGKNLISELTRGLTDSSVFARLAEETNIPVQNLQKMAIAIQPQTEGYQTQAQTGVQRGRGAHA